MARILSPKGRRGGVRIEILTDWPERLEAGVEVFLDDGSSLRIDRVERGGRAPVLFFAGRESREAIEPLIGQYLELPARELDEGSWFWDDLIGLRVVEPGGREVGELVEIFRAGGNEVYRVVGAGGERLIPALRSVVLEIDLEGGRMVVAPDEAEEVR